MIISPCVFLQSPPKPAVAKTMPTELGVVVGDATSPQLMATYAAYTAVFDRMALSEGSIGLINVRAMRDVHLNPLSPSFISDSQCV